MSDERPFGGPSRTVKWRRVPGPTLWPRVRQWSAERARPLARGKGVPIFRMARRFESTVLPEIAERSGNWWGNETAWRRVIDLVRILRRERFNAGKYTLFVYDGFVSGEGAGPLAPDEVDLGFLAVATDPVAGDLVVAGEMGIDPERIPLLREAARNVWGRIPFLRRRFTCRSVPVAERLLLIRAG